MITIALNNYINIDQKYYLEKYIFPIGNNSLSLDEFKQVLSFCSLNREPLKIVGGEPSIHPDFQQILIELNKYCVDNDTYVFVYTNATNLEQYITYIGDRIHIVIDCITTEAQNIDYFEEQKKFLDRAYNLSWFDNKCLCRFNLYPNMEDIDFMWDFVKEYKLKKIELAITAPSEEQKVDKKEFYKTMALILTHVCQKAIDNNCSIILSNGYAIPICFLTDEQYAIIMRAITSQLEMVNEPDMEIVIFPDLKASIPTKHSMSIDYTIFNNPDQLKNYIAYEIFYPTLCQNRLGVCSMCEKPIYYKCQGGNLKFANV